MSNLEIDILNNGGTAKFRKLLRKFLRTIILELSAQMALKLELVT